MISKELIDSIPELKGLDYEQIAAWFNVTPLIGNPNQQGTIPKPFVVAELFGLLKDPNDLKVITDSLNLIDIGDRIAAKIGAPNPHTPQSMLAFFAQNGLSEVSKMAISARLLEEIPDPNYQPQIPGQPRWQELGLSRAVRPEDVQEAVNNAAA